MKKYSNQESEGKAPKNNWPLNAADTNQDDRELDREEEEDEKGEDGDWGDVDPAGGPAPSAPGSAV